MSFEKLEGGLRWHRKPHAILLTEEKAAPVFCVCRYLWVCESEVKISHWNRVSVLKMQGLAARVWAEQGSGGVIFSKTSGTAQKDQILPVLLSL